MDPVTLGIIAYAAFKTFSKKPATPAAVDQTAAQLEAAAQEIMLKGSAAVNEITQQIQAQGKAFNLTFGGAGGQGGYTAYATLSGGYPPYMPENQVRDFSATWNSYVHKTGEVIKDGAVDHAEAMAVIALARELVSMLMAFAQQKQDFESQMAAAQKKTI